MWFWTPACVLHWGRYRGNAAAIRSNGRVVSYYQLATSLTAIAETARLRRLSKERVGLIAEHKENFVSALLGLQLAGCSVVMYNPLLSPDQLAITVQDSKPAALVTDFDVAASKIADPVSSIPQQILISELASGTPSELDSFLGNPTWAQPDLSDEWGVLFTSGSTGAPKAILHDNYSMMTESLAWILELELRKSSAFYVARPIYYTGGLVFTLSMLSIGGSVFLDNLVDPNDEIELLRQLQSAVNQVRLDWCFMVPEQVRRIIASEAKWTHAANPTSILVMGSPITSEEKLSLGEYFGCHVVESWGNSEGLGTISDPEDLVARPSSIGRPFLSERVFVVDEDGSVCAPGSIGRLAGSDETMFTEYLNRPEATAIVKRNALVISDDVGYRDAQGYFHILGRAQDVVTIDGRTIVVSEIERRVRKIDPVREICVSALEKDQGIGLYAVLEMVESDIPPNLLDDVNNVLPEEEHLSDITVVEKIPRLASGKLDRMSARKIIEAKFGSG